MPRLRAFLLEQPRVFHRNRSFACQHAQQLEVALVERSFLIREYGHRADRAVVGDQRNAAETAARSNRVYAKLLRLFRIIFANQYGLARADNIFGNVISRRPRANRQTNSVDDLQIETHFVQRTVYRSDIKILHVKQSP